MKNTFMKKFCREVYKVKTWNFMKYEILYAIKGSTVVKLPNKKAHILYRK